jgi:hypothetical protein
VSKRAATPVKKKSCAKKSSPPRNIYADLDGAPYKIGVGVKVLALTDETADNDLINHSGVVVFLEYSCGCGQSYPGDPMIGVRFGRRIAEFWKEELTLVD